MPGVQAPPHLDHFERALHLLGGLDQRARVRMQRERQARTPTTSPSISSRWSAKPRPAPVVELPRRAPLEVLDDAGHEHLGRRPRRSVARPAGPPRSLRSASGSCSTSGTNPPTSSVRGASATPRCSPARRGRTRAGRAPCRAARAPPSRRARSGEGIRPQPGTSQAPQEMGAPANLSSIGAVGRIVRACVSCMFAWDSSLALDVDRANLPCRLERSNSRVRRLYPVRSQEVKAGGRNGPPTAEKPPTSAKTPSQPPFCCRAL